MKYINQKMNFYLCCFLAYSFLGWCIETLYIAAAKGRIQSGGFFSWPLRPIYGFGALLIIFLLRQVKHNPVYFFLGAVFLASVLEYMTGIFLQSFIGRTLWNYNKEFLNLHGLICLKFSTYWGLLASCIMYLFHPAFRTSLRHIPLQLQAVFSYAILLLFIFSFLLSNGSLLSL